MRQGQQNRRGRGRSNQSNNNNNNQQRKGQNPLTRSFESNGPDVKLRGTPAHIAEKYMSLARDAQSSGDPVLAENHLQHAEHYNRIIMAYREQQVSQGGADPGYNGTYTHATRGEGNFDGDSDDGYDNPGDQPLPPRQSGSDVPQPRLHDNGSERRFDDRPPRPHTESRPHHQGPRDRDRSYQGDRGGYDRRDRPERADRNDRPERQERQDRPERQFDRPDRPSDRPSDRPDRPERLDRGDRPDRPERSEPRLDRDRPERFERPQPQSDVRNAEPRPEGAVPRRRERPPADRLPSEAHHEQPEFLRRPVRRPRREDQDEAIPAAAAPIVAASDDSE